MGKYKNIWKRSQDGSHRIERSFVRTTILAAAFLMVFLLFKKDNIIRWAQAGITIRRQESEIRRNEKTIEQMDRRIYDLTSNRDTLERFARERFHFTRKGDDLYIVKSR